MLSLVEKEYTIFENKSLLFKPTGQWYNEGEYDMRGKTPWICTNYSIGSSINGSIKSKSNGKELSGQHKHIIMAKRSIICAKLRVILYVY